MVRNRSRTTCNLPGTLVGHSKITISLLNSAWFARYSGFLVGSILVTNTPHRRLVSVVGGEGGLWETFLGFFSEKKIDRKKSMKKIRDEKKNIRKKIDRKKFRRNNFCSKKNCPKKISTEKMFVRKKFRRKNFLLEKNPTEKNYEIFFSEMKNFRSKKWFDDFEKNLDVTKVRGFVDQLRGKRRR